MKRRSKRTRKDSRRSRAKQRSNARTIETVEQFFALPERAREIQIAVANGVSLMRSDNLSASAAARATGISPSVLRRRGRSALQKLKNGRYAAKAYDHLLRVVIVVSETKGPVEVATRDSREASKAGRHSAAIHKYLETGDPLALAQFKREHIIDAAGERIELLADLEELDELGSAGVLSFESLYARGL
jgi:hypothetical protein